MTLCNASSSIVMITITVVERRHLFTLSCWLCFVTCFPCKSLNELTREASLLSFLDALLCVAKNRKNGRSEEEGEKKERKMSSQSVLVLHHGRCQAKTQIKKRSE